MHSHACVGFRLLPRCSVRRVFLPHGLLTSLPRRVPSAQALTARRRLQLPFGDTFVLVGDHENLGAWDPEQGLAMQWTEGDVWQARCQPACRHNVSRSPRDRRARSGISP